MSRPDRGPGLAVDFAPPRRRKRTLPLSAVALLLLAMGAILVAVTQLLLR